MRRFDFKAGERALVVVAHPDDETIWMGGFILTHPRLKWTIFSLCRRSDPDRRPKFASAARIYGAKAIIADLEDEGRLNLEESIPLIRRLVVRHSGRHSFDYLFTHGANGEYGHLRHRGVHAAVSGLAREGRLKAKTVFCFNYRRRPHRRPSMAAKKDSELIVPLRRDIFYRKKKLQAEVYGYDWRGIDVGLCPNPEAFKTLSL